MSERKHQKPEVLTSNKIGELSGNPSERKENFGIVLSDKQETCLHEIYQRMPNVGGEFIHQGLHNDAFDMASGIPFRTICGFLDKRSHQYISNCHKNIYISEGDIYGHAIDSWK